MKIALKEQKINIEELQEFEDTIKEKLKLPPLPRTCSSWRISYSKEQNQ